MTPGKSAGAAQVLRWSLAALSSVEVPLLSRWFVGITGGADTSSHAALGRWADLRLGQLDAWLADRPFVATDDFTVADLLLTHVLTAGSTDPALLELHPRLRAYLARCLDRPAWKRTIAAYEARVEAG
ncbi:MAG: glutathione binding-like protein [Myxococcota bacterium]